MNWSDFVVVGVIGLFAIIGLFKGFIMSIYRLVSFVVCVFLSIKLSPILARLISNTPFYDGIKSALVKNIETWSNSAFASQTAAAAGVEGAETVLGTMPMPEVLRDSVLNNMPSPSELLDMNGIVNAIGDQLTGVIISVLSLIVLYIVLRLIMAMVGILLRKISDLPVFKQVNKIGGFILGGLQGFLVVYIIFAVLMIFNSYPQLMPVFDNIESSMIAGGIFENNFIINFLFPTVSA